MERFEVLWFPTVTALPVVKEIQQVAAGLPHCKTCVEPLSLSGGQNEWACRRCGARFPATLADLFVTDTLAKDALKFFQERHADYKYSPEFAQNRKR